MITLLAPAIGFLTGPLGRYAMIGLALFGGIMWLRADARREVVAACTIKLETLDRTWRSRIETANKEANSRVALALTEAQQTADAPTAPAELVRLCKSEPAGCRAIQP